MSSNTHGNSAAAIMLLMFVAGIGIPVMATLNARLGQQLASPVAATAVLFAGGLILSAAILCFTGRPSAASFASVPPGFFLGAIFVVFYILSITWAGPRIGIGNAVFFVLLGQMVAAAAIDHLGLWGAIQSTLTVRRTVGIAVMAAGVYLSRRVA